MERDPRVDAYITQAAPFAQPILMHLRAIVHAALPEAGEGIKWGMPHFLIGGKNVAGIAAFKAHCALVIHGDQRRGEGMGSYGRITRIEDIPAEAELIAALHMARERIATHGRATKVHDPREAKPELPVPGDFADALAANAKAQTTFDGFSAAQRREYIEWITGAKREQTRTKRIATALEWLAEGKKRNWKYENC